LAGFADQVKGGKKYNYAVYVHEMTDEAYGKKIIWSRPDSGPKFLEKALDRNADKVVGIVAGEVKKAIL
jgi:hypothetical protein